MASKAKKKAEVSSKKDKKKDKKKAGKEPTTITDVIAIELMEKAKRTLGTDDKVKKEGVRTPSPPPAPLITDNEPEAPTPPRIHSPPQAFEKEQDDEFNIPTISEIATSAGSSNLHKKELSQLQELQNRIYQTKRKLKDLDSGSDEEMPTTNKSIMSRLGVKPTENSKPSNIISLSAIRRTEKEIYVAPSFRKLIERQKVENDRRDEAPRTSRVVNRRGRRSRSRSRSSRDRHRNRRERSRSPIRRDKSPVRRSRSPRIRASIHQRIGSRVVVASPERAAPVKPKFRPALSSAITGQAGKNLLLRAVAEAQRSTALVVQDQRRKPPRDNIVVQVPIRKDKRAIRVEEEYVPESISTQSESEAEYHPSYAKNTATDDGDDGDVIYLNNNEDVDLEDLDKSPQFVVTLEGATQFDNNSKSSHSPTPPPVIKRKSIKDRIGVRAPITTNWEERQPVKRKAPEDDDWEERNQAKRMTIDEESESQRAYNRAKRARVSPIKFDLTDEEDDRKSRDTSREKRSETPEMKENNEKKSVELNGEEIAKRIRLEPSRSFDHVPSCKRVFLLIKLCLLNEKILMRFNFFFHIFSAQLNSGSSSGFGEAQCKVKRTLQVLSIVLKRQLRLLPSDIAMQIISQLQVRRFMRVCSSTL